MGKTNKFYVKDFEKEENSITVGEEKNYHNPFIRFLISNGKLIFTISLLLSVAVFIIALTLSLKNMGESSIVMYEENGVVVNFNGTDNSIINGTPITSDYALKTFVSNINEDNYLKGVVILLDKKDIHGNTYMFYSDKTIIIKYKDNTYKKIYPIDNKYGVYDSGIINAKVIAKDLTGETKINKELGIELIYLSDGSIIVSKGNANMLVRNNDVTDNENIFYGNLSGTGILVEEKDNIYHYSNNIITDENFIEVNNIKYNKIEEKTLDNGIKIIYYDSDYAEVIYKDTRVIVEKKDHIKYEKNIFEIVDNNKNEENIDIKDIMNIKNIKLKNTNKSKAYYMIVLEESNNYNKYNIDKRLDTKYINYNIYVNGNTITNKVLDNKININKSKKNNYLIYEGYIDKLSEQTIDIGMWISYENITNEYMNSGFVGTMKVYIETK